MTEEEEPLSETLSGKQKERQTLEFEIIPATAQHLAQIMKIETESFAVPYDQAYMAHLMKNSFNQFLVAATKPPNPDDVEVSGYLVQKLKHKDHSEIISLAVSSKFRSSTLSNF